MSDQPIFTASDVEASQSDSVKLFRKILEECKITEKHWYERTAEYSANTRVMPYSDPTKHDRLQDDVLDLRMIRQAVLMDPISVMSLLEMLGFIVVGNGFYRKHKPNLDLTCPNGRQDRFEL